MAKKPVEATEEKKSSRIVLKGIAFWAHVQEVNRLSGKFQLDLSIDATTAKKLEAIGIDIKEEDEKNVGTDKDRGQFVTLKSEYPPSLLDAKKNKLANSILIGNGSIVNVATHPYDWTFGKKSGTALGLDAVQIVELVAYKDNLSDMFEEVDGFTSTETDDDMADQFEDVSEKKAPKVTKENPF